MTHNSDQHREPDTANEPFHLDYQRETLARLRAAMKWSDRTLSVVPPERDLHQGTSLANAWAIITTAYSGVEQSIKYLISQRSHNTVHEWRCGEDGKRLGNSHALIKLFNSLDAEAQHFATEYYERFQSLHSYITKSTLRGFLEEISRGERGYGLWRYVLVEDSPRGLPRNSPDAMLAIWSALVRIIEHRQGRGRPVVMPDEDLWDMLKSYDPLLRNRMEQADHPLNACAQMIWENYRGIAQSQETEKALSEWIGRVRERRDRNLEHLMQRARGTTDGGSGVLWNRTRNRFEDIPWTLPMIESDEKPSESRSIDTDTKDGLRHAILLALHRSDFSVAERMLDQHRARSSVRRGRKPKWQCTLHAEKSSGSGETVVLRIWESILDHSMHISTRGDYEGSIEPRCWEVVKLLSSI